MQAPESTVINDPLGFALGPGHSAFVVDFDLGRYPDVALDGGVSDAPTSSDPLLEPAAGSSSTWTVRASRLPPLSTRSGNAGSGPFVQHLFLDL
ncbi:MAG: hypothetical protein CM1200mP20_03860 [Pseudomonadota bacterium]|nr:MAG: hypothetical protein CM1200mP20_03860 [Pseudomonadota bacterium]